MSRLNDVISQAIDTVRDARGRVNVHSAVEIALGLIDDEDGDTLIRAALSERIKRAAERGTKAIETAAAEPLQGALFKDLRRAYALDEEGRVVKSTDDLTQLEFERIIRIREQSIESDLAHLKILRQALITVRSLWSSHPDWTFAQVCNAHRAAA